MNLLHVRAKLAVTYGEKLLLRVLLQQFIEHAHLGADQEDFLIRIRRIINNLGGTSDKICQLQHIAGTLRMRQHNCLRMQLFCFLYIFRMNTLMYMAETVIENKMFLRHFFCDKTSQILIRNKENILVRQFFHDFECIR